MSSIKNYARSIANRILENKDAFAFAVGSFNSRKHN